MSNFTSNFIKNSISILEQINQSEIEAVAEVLSKCRAANGRLFFCGSGGGAGHASHATADFRKLGGFEAYSVTDNVSELTARTNDEGWESSYSAWLDASKIRSGDCVFVFSVGGGSEEPPVSVNLVNAVRKANSVGASVVGVIGRDGGYIRQESDASILIPTIDSSQVTPQVEGFQAVMWHLLVSHPKVAVGKAKWEGMSTNQK
jgi:D-sedoheptulose 7-phosphate isomerase